MCLKKLHSMFLNSLIEFWNNKGDFFIVLIFVFVGAFGIDQLSKYHAHKNLLIWEDPQNNDTYLGGKFHLFHVGNLEPKDEKLQFHFRAGLHYSRNKGAAFSLLADLNDNIRVPFFYGVTILAIIIICMYFYTTPINYVFTYYGLMMILIGALGNFTDRILRGYVIDFIDVDWNLFGWKHDFAIFNIADICINIGVICLIIDIIIHWKDSHSIQKQSK